MLAAMLLSSHPGPAIHNIHRRRDVMGIPESNGYGLISCATFTDNVGVSADLCMDD